jgi:GTP cyclohydrolase IB
MHLPEAIMMHDIQGEADDRGIEIDEVGITGLRYPLTFDDGTTRQSGIAHVEITVRLQHDRRGTHMSRMLTLVHDQLRDFDPRALPITLKSGASLLDAPGLKIRVGMPLATTVTSPVTGLDSCQVHEVAVVGTWTPDAVTVSTSITSEVTSLCPCSKAVSDYGAHNQRSQVTLTVTGNGGDLIYPLPVSAGVTIIRESGSAPVIPLVKRPDERHLTMQAYDHPVFVEDMARIISSACRQRGLRHSVRIRNLESIHSHDAVAYLSG